MKRPLPLAVSLTIALLLPACSGSAKTAVSAGNSGPSSSAGPGPTSTASGSALASPTTSSTPGPLIVVEHDFGLATNTATVSGGSVVFNITNQGPSSHELLVFRTDLPQDQLPLGPDGRINEDAIPKVVDTETDLAAGTQRQLTEPLTPGRYVLVCNLLGHYKLGMHTVITVT